MFRYTVVLLLCLTILNPAFANPEPVTLKEDPDHITRWTEFYQALVNLHQQRTNSRTVTRKDTTGGYANQPEYYLESIFTDSISQQMLSRIRYTKSRPEEIHTIEIFIYDEDGRLVRDYLAAYLPDFRNAPIQTLINLHNHDQELKAFRQFDASGNLIYEQCLGRYFDEEISLSLEEDDLPSVAGATPQGVSHEIYLACFNSISISAEPYLDLSIEIPGKGTLTSKNAQSTAVSIDIINQLDLITLRLAQQPEDYGLYLQRGNLHFELQNFTQAIADFSTALNLNDNLDEAYFGRGMAHGRAGNIRQGINDLTVYIKRNPTEARAYTKRGVRLIWLGELVEAERDLRTAIILDPESAEAHDDLGVILAQRGNYNTALKHFRQTITIDKNYQKGYHNLATTYFLLGDYHAALKAIEQALRLRADAKNSVLLKGEILSRLGKEDEAQKFFKSADQLQDGNWSENWAIQ